MDKENLNVSHLAWCGLIALHTARQDGIVTSPAQDNLFMTRWLATAEKQRHFGRELASDISWLLKEGRQKGLRADLPGSGGPATCRRRMICSGCSTRFTR
ncbi:DUF2913 family protein [Pantoea agglomerans]|jgi:hypothetical protein|uniref:DUF2913 family protein n=1 Tax=Enterobacter agglomerans TaxID=549 RepID=UPI002027903A